MKILVTGASGFVGSWVVRILSEHHELSALIRPNSSTYRIQGIKGITLIRAPEESWAKEIVRITPDILILADWWGVENFHRNDLRQFDNVDRFKALVDAGIKVETSRIIGVGSQAELGPVSNQIFEGQVDNPTTHYGKAKVQARRYLLDLSSSKTSTSWLRIFSTYGPLDTGSWLIPNTIRSLLRNESMDLTKGEQRWSYLYISDLAEAFSTCITKEISGLINVGNPETITIREVVLEIGRHLQGEHLLNFAVVPYRKDQVMLMLPVCETLTKAGWKPIIEIKSGIHETINWMSGNQTLTLNKLGIPVFTP